MTLSCELWTNAFGNTDMGEMTEKGQIYIFLVFVRPPPQTTDLANISEYTHTTVFSMTTENKSIWKFRNPKYNPKM